MQQVGKHVSVPTSTHAIMDDLLVAVISVRSVWCHTKHVVEGE